MTTSEHPFYFVTNRADIDGDGGPYDTQEEAARVFASDAREAYDDPRDWHTCEISYEEGIDVYGDSISTTLMSIGTQNMDESMFGPDGNQDNRLHWAILEDGDPEIIEELHSECAPCSMLYYAARYAMAHYAKHGEAFEPLVRY